MAKHSVRRLFRRGWPGISHGKPYGGGREPWEQLPPARCVPNCSKLRQIGKAQAIIMLYGFLDHRRSRHGWATPLGMRWSGVIW